MTLTDEDRAALRELLEYVQRGHSDGQYDTNLGVPPDGISIIENGPRLVWRLADALSLRSEATLSARGAQDLIHEACWRFVATGQDAAVRQLDEALHGRLRRWKVIRPCRMLLGADVIEVGRCRIQRGLPPPPPGQYYGDPVLEQFAGLTIATEVEGYDLRAARELAAQAIAEAFAVLQLSDWDNAPVLGPAVIVHHDDGTMSHNPNPTIPLRGNRGIHSRGELGPYQAALSVAAAKPLTSRTDWERRTLAAARWLSKGLGSVWNSDALLSFVVCLETLMLGPEDPKRGKGSLIARRISAIAVVAPMDERTQRRWIIKVYDRRGDVVHEGLDPPTDVDVSRLGFLAWTGVVWASSHLVPDHQQRPRPCLTFAEAHSNHNV